MAGTMAVEPAVGIPNPNQYYTAEISVEARNINVHKSSGLMCELHMRDFETQNLRETGRTEVVRNHPAPKWTKRFIKDFYFESKQQLKFEIFEVFPYDEDNDTYGHKKSLGVAECSFSELCGQLQMVIPLRGESQKFSQELIILRYEKRKDIEKEVMLNVLYQDLPRSCFWRPMPFLVIEKEVQEGRNFSRVYKSSISSDPTTHSWSDIRLDAVTLCNADLDRRMRFQCFDASKSPETLIGSAVTTLRELQLHHSGKPRLEMVKPADIDDTYLGTPYIHFMRPTQVSPNTGVLNITVKVKKKPTYFDYRKPGQRIRSLFFVDFSSSNHHPNNEPFSDHMTDHMTESTYYKAIHVVGSIPEKYGSEPMIPAYGFGALLPDDSFPDVFPLNGKQGSPECSGVEEVLLAYRSKLESLRLHGPSNLTPIIDHVSRQALSHEDGSAYFLAFIFTDGGCTDMDQLIPALIKASHLPISVIIIGIGDSKFTAMEKLVSETKLLTWKKEQADRHILHFVAYKDFDVKEGPGESHIGSLLTREVMSKFPAQFVEYMVRHEIPPQGTRAIAKVPPAAAAEYINIPSSNRPESVVV